MSALVTVTSVFAKTGGPCVRLARDLARDNRSELPMNL